MKRAWDAWVSLWDRTESPVALALVRIFVGVALLADLLRIAVLGIVGALYSAAPDGYAMPATDLARALVEHGLGPAIWVVAVIAAAGVALGVATRISCVALLLATAQLAHIAPDSDRGIHVAFRIVLAILALSQSHARWSIDAWLWARLGRPFPALVPAWPRYLLLLQLLWIYFSAGIQKAGAEWGPWGGFLAVANTATDPNYARFDPAWLEMFLPLTRVATAATLLFEVTAPLYLVWLYCAETADRPGRARAWINKLRLRWIWIGLGVAFHLGLAVTVSLGVFPWGMLALYPVLLRAR
ncbi:MAG: HTTM domain-containing protein [Myxococcales bacterium]|nr:HTTM domain-containing protein [Myxococcales bacterium]